MNISELISILQDLQERVGDAPIDIEFTPKDGYGGGGYGAIVSIEYVDSFGYSLKNYREQNDNFVVWEA